MAGEVNEEMKKCGFCKKTVKNHKKYYRNNRYYCNANCWNKAKAEAKTAEGESEAEAESQE